MTRKMNLIISLGDDSDLHCVDSFLVDSEVEDSEAALRAAVTEFFNSGSNEAQNTIERANGQPNWGDALMCVPDALFEKYGLTRIREGVTDDVRVQHDEILFEA